LRGFRTARSLIALTALLLGVALAACTAPVPVDQQVAFGDGYAQVHVPVAHSSIGVIVLHSLSHGTKEMVEQGWSKLSDTEHFVAIYPYRDSSWNAGMCCGYGAETNRDDVAWLTTVITTLRLKYRLNRIYVAGNSNGGMMAEQLVAAHPWLTSRIAVWGGAPEMVKPGVWTGYAAIFDGKKDKTVPWGGGVAHIAGQTVQIRPALTTGDWLKGAQLKGFLIAGAGHPPEDGWPLLAWQQLSR
jgi:polyhydroxybutyrate depolymerase